MINVHGRTLLTSKKAMRAEFQKLADYIGAEYHGEVFAADYIDHPIKLKGAYDGYPCQVVGLNHPDSLPAIHASSITLILHVNNQSSRKLKLQNVISERIGHYVSIHKVDDELYDRLHHFDYDLVTREEVDLLEDSGLHYVLTLVDDRLAFTIYGIYEADVYVEALEFMKKILERLDSVAAQP